MSTITVAELALWQRGGFDFTLLDVRRAQARAVARGVALRQLLRLQHQVERHAETAPMLAVTPGAGAKFMRAEMQRKARFGHLETAEFESADRMPLADRRPAVAA